MPGIDDPRDVPEVSPYVYATAILPLVGLVFAVILLSQGNSREAMILLAMSTVVAVLMFAFLA